MQTVEERTAHITVRDAQGAESDWLDDDDRFFNEEWEEELGEIVSSGSTEKKLVIEIDGQRAVLSLEAGSNVPDFQFDEAVALIVRAVNSFPALVEALKETLGDLCSQLELETGLIDDEINERPSVIKARAALSAAGGK